MINWKDRGYVPDSDEEDADSEYLAASQVPAQRDKAGPISQPSGHCSHGTDHHTESVGQPLPFNHYSLETTADQLGETLSQALSSVRAILSNVYSPEHATLDDESPLSSLPSSIQSSPRLVPLSEDEAQYAQLVVPHEQRPGVGDGESTSFAPRRHLRERAPIQLHPYMLEDAKYRELMKTRGLRPINAPRPAISEDAALTAEDTQDTELYQSSQAQETQAFQLPSSPIGMPLDAEEESQSPVRGSRQAPRVIDDLDDELPDVLQILRRRNAVPKKVYRAQKPNRALQIDPKPVNAREKTFAGSPNSMAVPVVIHRHQASFSVPPSPPHSSSVVTNDDLPDSRDAGRHPESLTPGTSPYALPSSEYARSKRMRIVLSSSDASVSSSDTSDESENEQNGAHGMQMMSRRIKGVLPASWLKLDMKRVVTGSKKQCMAQSLLENVDDRGVARRVPLTARAFVAPSRSLGRDLSDLRDDDSDEELVPVDTAERSDASDIDLGGHSDLAADTMLEEDIVDAMLPSSNTRRKQSKSTRGRQSRLDERWNSTSKQVSKLSKSSTGNTPHTEVPYSRQVQRTARHKRRKRQHQSPPVRVLDAPGLQSVQRNIQPLFLKLAARQARRNDHTSALPASKKVFQLATQKDTEEINQVIDRFQKVRSVQQRPAIAAARQPNCHAAGAHDDLIRRPQQCLNSEEKRPTSNTDFESLKDQTTALLQRVAHSSSAKLSEEALNKTTTRTAAPLSDPVPNTGIAHLRALFPRSNRSGRGQLLSTLSSVRPGQLEYEAITPRKQVVKFPRSAESWPTRFLLRPQQQVTRASSATDDLPSPIPPGVRENISRQPRKKPPKLWESEKPVKRSNATHLQRHLQADIMAVPYRAELVRTGQLCGEHPVSSTGRRDRAYMLSTTAYMKRALESLGNFRFDPLTIRSFSLDSVLRKCLEPELHIRAPAEIYATLILVNFHSRIGPYDSRARDAIKQCHLEIRQIVETSNLTYDHTMALHCLASLKSLAEYIDEALSFPAELMVRTPANDGNGAITAASPALGSMTLNGTAPPFNTMDTRISSRYDFVRTTLTFIETVIQAVDEESLVHMDIRKFFRAVLGWLAIIVLQLYYIAHDLEDFTEQIHTLWRTINRRVLSKIFSDIELTNHINNLTEARDDRNHSQALIYANQSFEIESVIIALHGYIVMSDDCSAAQFFDLLDTLIAETSGRGPIRDACMALSAICYILPLSALDATGTIIPMSKNLFVGNVGWSILVPHLNKLVANFSDQTPLLDEDRAQREFAHSVITFIQGLIFEWHWLPTPAIVTVLFKAYSFNDMLPFEEIVGGLGLFKQLDLFVPDVRRQKTDYEKFLDIVKLAIELQQAASRDEEGSRSAKSASKMRAFVFSLFPNQAQLCDAREDLHAAQFLAVKNHLALYLALYRSAPEGCGPRVKQLEQQVDLVYSHSTIAKLAIKIWQAVAQHEIERGIAGTNALQDIGQWLQTIFLQLAQRIVEIQKAQTVKLDQTDVPDLWTELIMALNDCLAACPTEATARRILEPVIGHVGTLLPPMVYSGEAVTRATVTMLATYAKKLHSCQAEETLSHRIFPMLKSVLHFVLTTPAGSELTSLVVSAWFYLASSMVHSFRKHWDDFLLPTSSHSIDFITGPVEGLLRNKAKQEFMSQLIQSEKDSVFLEYRPIIFGDWIAALLVPIEILVTTPIDSLTRQIVRYGGESLNLKGLFRRLHGNRRTDSVTMQDVVDSRLVIIQHLIETIYSQQDDPESDWLAGGLDEQDMTSLLQIITNQMKVVWLQLKDAPVMQYDYTRFVEAVVGEIETYPVKGFKLDPWFTDGLQFPRHSQTLEALFRCRFGEDGCDLAKSSVVTFRMQCIEAFKFGKQETFAAELKRIFLCTDPARIRKLYEGGQDKLMYSIDLHKQTQFLQIVFPVYVEQAGTESGAAVVAPLVGCLSFITDHFALRVDNLEAGSVVEFVAATISNLAAARAALRTQTKLLAITPALLEYSSIAIDTVWSYLSNEAYEFSLDMQEAFAANVMDLVRIAGNLLPEEEEVEMKAVVARFVAECECRVEIEVGEKAKEVGAFARKDLQESLGGLSGVEEKGFEREKVEEAVRALFALVKALPLVCEEEEE